MKRIRKEKSVYITLKPSYTWLNSFHQLILNPTAGSLLSHLFSIPLAIYESYCCDHWTGMDGSGFGSQSPLRGKLIIVSDPGFCFFLLYAML